MAHTQQKLTQAPPPPPPPRPRERNQHLSFRYMECVLTRIIFVTDVAVVTIETTKLVFKPVIVKQFHFLKPLDIFMTLLKYAMRF